MRRIGWILGLAVGAVALAPGVFSQAPPKYDPAAEVEVRGTLESVESHAGWMGWDGTYGILKTDDGLIEVHFAPASFLKSMELVPAAGDRLELVGVRARVEGRDVLLVRTIRRSRVTLNVRSAKGSPLW